MDALTRRVAVNPAVGLGVAIVAGLALGTGILGDLLPFGRPGPTPPPAPATTAGGPVARPATGDLASHLDQFDQEA
jgi:hypothetical protein